MEDTNIDTTSGFPSDFVSKEEKELPAYGIKIGKGIWSKAQYRNLFNDRKLKWVNLRRWGQGLQPIDNMKELMATFGDLSNLNISWSAPSIVAKMVDVMTSMILNNTYVLGARAHDPLSESSKDVERRKMLANIFMKKDSDALEQQGLPPLVSETPKMEDMEMAEILHGTNFKLGTEMATTSALEWVMLNNGFEQIKEKIVRDLVEIKYAVTYTYIENARIKVMYIDPVMWGSPIVRKDDFTDAGYMWHIEYLTLGQLKLRAGNQFIIDNYIQMAKSVNGLDGNPNLANDYLYYPQNENHFWEHKIRIVHFEYKSINNDIDIDVEDNYMGSYVVGTDFIYNYGLKKNIIRERLPDNTFSLDTELGYTVIAPDIRDMQNKSHVDRMIPAAEQMHLAMLNIQRFLTSIIPPGATFDLSQMMDNIVIGKGEKPYEPLNAMVLWRQLGVQFRKSIKPNGDTNMAEPIIAHAGYIGDFTKLIGVYNFWLNTMYNDLGINDLAAGATPNPETLSGVAKLSANAVANAIRPLKNAFKSIVVRTGKKVVLNIQLSLDDESGRKMLANAIGKSAEEILELGKNIQQSCFNIDMQFLPEDEEKAKVDMQTMEGIKQGYIKPEDLAILKDITQPAMAYMYLSKKRVTYDAEQQKIAAQNTQQQGAMNTQVAQASEQAKSQAQIEILKAQSELEQVKSDLRIQEMMVEYKLKGGHLSQEMEAKYKIAMDTTNAKQSQTSDLTK